MRFSGDEATRRTRRPIGGFELAICLLVALQCLAINALAVAHIPLFSLDSLGPLALAYHDKQPGPIFIAAVILALLAGTWLPPVGRAAVLVFAGAAAANLASPAIWDPGIPDYIVVRRLDVIANAADLLIVAASVVIVASMVVPVVRRLPLLIRSDR